MIASTFAAPSRTAHQVLGKYEVAEHAFAQVHPTLVLAEPVAHRDVGVAALVQRRDDIGADEPRRAGDDDHARTLPAPSAAEEPLSISRVVDWPGTRSTVITRPPAFCTMSAPTIWSIV